MNVEKAGCILINTKRKEVGLVYRPKRNDYSFPKGHMEANETLVECAIRETQEETCRMCHIISSNELGILKYTTPLGKIVNVYMYLAIDDGPVPEILNPSEVEEIVWTSFEKVEDVLSFDNLKDFWNEVKPKIEKLLNNFL